MLLFEATEFLSNLLAMTENSSQCYGGIMLPPKIIC